MPYATYGGGQLVEIPDCYVAIPGYGQIVMRSLPEISDSKGASYNDEPGMGRSSPLKTYSHSENRAISMTLHFFTLTSADVSKNLAYLRALQSAVYPSIDSTMLPYLPPPICQIKCGQLLGSSPLCVVLKSYSVHFPTDVSWNESSLPGSGGVATLLPMKFDVETSWDVVYVNTNLPGSERIMSNGC